MKITDKGFSILELAVCLLVVSCVLGCVVALWSGATTLAKGHKTMSEMSSILGAAKQFYSKNNAWPTSITDIATMMPNAPTSNVFGNAYTVAGVGMNFYVESLVPPNAASVLKDGVCVVVTTVGANQKVRVSTTLMLGKVGRVQYDKKYVYP